MTDATVRAFVSQQRSWLLKELQCDNEATTEEGRSHVLHQLEALDVSVGLYGRTVLTLGPIASSASSSGSKNPSALLPAHRLNTGDEVEMRSKSAASSKKIPGGVISQVTETSLSIALFDGMESDSENLTPPLSILPKSSIEVHKKLMLALDDLEKHGANHAIAGAVIRAAFEVPDNTGASKSNLNPIQPFSDQLNESQLDAIAFALTENRPISLIHGPPGTGKTTTVVELIQQAVITRGYKVLVASPSNVAVDNVLERLVADPLIKSSNGGSKRKAANKLKVVRLGHPARLQPKILPFSLEALVQRADGTEIVADVRNELNSFLKILNNPKSRANDKRIAYKEIKALRKEVRGREEKIVQDLLSNAQVVLATCVGASNRLLRQVKFDLVVIDEAAQALEAQCWIPALRGAKLVLAGDHCQLPPTIKSNNPKVEQGLSRTMFERILDSYGDNRRPAKEGHVSRMLDVQYRMHETISDWASQAMYHGQLRTHDHVKHRTLSQLTGKSDEDGVSGTALMLIDTSGCHMYESVNAAGSRFNIGEAELVARQIRALVIDLGVQQEEIAVITPYNGQVEVLRATLLGDFPKLEIRSVDGFQGGEREAVILSLVRSSERGGSDGIGFLKNERRLNVAVTRAKRHCCVICDSETVAQSAFIKNLLAWVDEHGDPRSALEYQSDHSSNGLESDLLDAECVLNDIMRQTNKSVDQKKKKIPTSAPSRKNEDERRKELLVVIEKFAKSANPGDALSLGPELTSYDRMLVHEEAEKLGVQHRSEGDGPDRRIVLIMAVANDRAEEVSSSPIAALIQKTAGIETHDGALAIESEDETQEATAQFTNLSIDESEVEDEEEIKEVSEAAVNRLLGDLASERKARERRQEAVVHQQGHGPPRAKNAKKKKAQKLGGAKKAAAAPKKDESLDELDDMAFLDTQIDKVQNSHGRTIDARGSGYRTIVNGILLTKPKPAEQKKNSNKAAALQSKIHSAQADRKAKNKK